MSGSLLEPLFGDFKIHDVDEAGDPKYYGFQNSDGQWYIMSNLSDTTFRYATFNTSSEPDYATAWTNRASLTYDYLTS